MKFEKASDAAARLNVTVRAIQKWAKEGKIPYAHKVGRDWYIPTNAGKPNEQNTEMAESFTPPLPIISDFAPGEALHYINSIENEDNRNMALCQYYYLAGDMNEASLIAEPYLDSKNSVLKTQSAMMCIFANMFDGHLNKASYASEVMKQTVDNIINDGRPSEIIAANTLSAVTVKVQLHLPFSSLPLIEDYMKYLPEGQKAFACYLSAYKAYLNKDYARSLGIVETALNCSSECYPVAFIYLYLIGAIVSINLMQVDTARNYIEKAWQYAQPDDLYIPFVEHYNLLQGLIELHFKQNHPEHFAKIISATKKYNPSWYRVYNARSEYTVAKNLTHTEFTIAMLYSRNWKAKEIAAHMNLSERTIMNYIQVIYEKLHINGKKGLENFLLK